MGKNLVVHIDDSPEFREIVRNALNSLSFVDLSQGEDYNFFFNLPSYSKVDLYLLDVHFPNTATAKDSRGALNDEGWKNIASTSFVVNPDIPIVLLSGNPPKHGDWRRFQNVKQVFRKQEFNPEKLRNIVCGYLSAGGYQI